MRALLLALLLAGSAFAQTNGGAGASDPATCTVGSQFVNTTTGALKICTAANVWTVAGPSVGATAWGTITGTLATQSDLNTALAGKATSAQGAKADTALQANPNIGAATGASLAVTGALTSSGGGIGYTAGAGGTVSQLTSKATGVTLNKLSGTITMHNAALAAAAIVCFTVTNSFMGATDVVHMQHDTVGAIGGYTVMPNTSAAGSFRCCVRNNTAGSLSEAIVLRFAIFKAAAS